MEISIIHPSRNRPQMALETATKWITRCKDTSQIEYILSLDNDDHLLMQYHDLFTRLKDQVAIIQHNNSSAVEAINNAAPKTTGRILVVVSDDFDCPNHWDEQLIVSLKDKQDFVVKTKDGLQPFIITLPIMDRLFYNRFGYVYNPIYKHMFCDTEMSCVGHMLGRTINLDILFPHRHYTTRTTKRDAINIKNDQTFGTGANIFKERKRINFGITDPIHSCPL